MYMIQDDIYFSYLQNYYCFFEYIFYYNNPFIFRIYLIVLMLLPFYRYIYT